jgi:hypothetical protein
LRSFEFLVALRYRVDRLVADVELWQMDWRGLVDDERYGPMTADDAAFMRLTRLVKLRYAARRLGITATDLRGRIIGGSVRAQKIGSLWFLSEGEIERYAQRREARARSLSGA